MFTFKGGGRIYGVGTLQSIREIFGLENRRKAVKQPTAYCYTCFLCYELKIQQHLCK
jgi:hypothetical protein